MTATSQKERESCPVYTAMRVINGRWKPMMVWRLTDPDRRFGDLHRSMPGVSAKMLRQQLKEFETDGIVTRHVVAERPLHVEYRLTPYGRTLGPVFDALGAWGARHLRRPTGGSPDASPWAAPAGDPVRPRPDALRAPRPA